ncbi:MAG: M48 family metalloprotease [Gammaproteobacteria bacterium]|nr:M48 family metalloprotease [Gammaproteobacteria bacterium]
MNFFEQQRKNRQRSILVLGLFCVGVLLIGLAVHVVASLVAMASGESQTIWELSTHTKILIGMVWLTVALGSLFRWLDVRGGGIKLAQRFRAAPVLATSRSDADRLLLSVVAEIAVAAGQPMPSVWVLHRESTINAFVLGRKNDIALVVSQGALDLLDEDELRGIVAHEFGHLVQGDLPLNMRLLIVLGGLLAIDEVGRVLTGRDPQGNAHPGVIVGYVLCAVGSVGVFVASVIRAAYSRQREYLADASAVQFTRDTFGIASALDQAGSLYDVARLESPYAGELAHLCFHSESAWSWPGKALWRRWLSSHPTPQQRINAIEPYFQIKKRKRSRRESRSQTPSKQAPVIGNNVRVIDTVAELSGSFSDRFQLMVSDSTAGLAVLFALFASDQEEDRERYLADVGFAYNADFAVRVKECLDHFQVELEQCPLAIIRHVKPLLKEVQPENRIRLLRSIESILKSCNSFDIGSCVTLRLLKHELDVEFPLLDEVVGRINDQGELEALATAEPAQQRQVKQLSEITDEIALLLSLVVEASGAPQEEADECYDRVLQAYTHEDIPRRYANEPGGGEAMEAAFELLRAQPQITRQAFINHCAEIVLYDGSLLRKENILLQIFAAALDIDFGSAMSFAKAA